MKRRRFSFSNQRQPTSNGSRTPTASAPSGSAAASAATPASGATGDANPFEEEEWDEYPNEALVDSGEPGVPVKALYDYEGAEYDELSFKKGAQQQTTTTTATTSVAESIGSGLVRFLRSGLESASGNHSQVLALTTNVEKLFSLLAIEKK